MRGVPMGIGAEPRAYRFKVVVVIIGLGGSTILQFVTLGFPPPDVGIWGVVVFQSIVAGAFLWYAAITRTTIASFVTGTLLLAALFGAYARLALGSIDDGLEATWVHFGVWTIAVVGSLLEAVVRFAEWLRPDTAPSAPSDNPAPADRATGGVA